MGIKAECAQHSSLLQFFSNPSMLSFLLCVEVDSDNLWALFIHVQIYRYMHNVLVQIDSDNARRELVIRDLG